jgi:hypothetical protein
MASFTSADESTYVARSALIAAQSIEDARRGLLSGRQGKWLRQVLQIGTGGFEIAGRPQAFDRTLVREGCEHGYRSTAISDLDRLAGLHPS